MPKLSRLTRIALLILGVVIVALTIYTYPSLAGFTTLAFRAVVILGALAILTVLGASLLNRKSGGFAYVVLLTSVGVIAFSWSQISATRDSRVFAAEIAEAGDTPDALFRTIASSRTDTAGRVRGVYTIAALTDREIDALLSGLATPDTPSIAAMFGTTLVTDADTLAAARAAIPAITTAAAGARAEIERLLDAEVAAVEAFDTSGLPDSARLLFVDAALRRIAAEREIYLALSDVGVDRAAVRERMLAFLEVRSGAYAFDETAARALFADPAVDAEYTLLLDELAALDAEDARLRTEHSTLMYEAAKELITAAGATP